MDSTESGALSKQYILQQCKEWASTLDSNTFISLTHADTKMNILNTSVEQLSSELENTSPSKGIPWSGDTLSFLCSAFVCLYEKHVPPNVLFTNIMRSKKANIHTCRFAFILFDKYIIMRVPNYFHLMCSFLQDSRKV